MIDRGPISVLATVLSALTLAIPADGQVSDLIVTKTSNPSGVFAGENVTYSIVVDNFGPDDSAAIGLTDTLASNTTFVSLVSSPGWSCSTPAVGSSGTVFCTSPGLAAETLASFTLVAQVRPTVPFLTQIFNSASTSCATDPIPINNLGTTSIFVGSSADLSIAKTASPDPVEAGENLSYEITLTNDGPSVSNGAAFSDPLPAGTSFVSLSSPAGWSCTTPAVGSGGTVDCSNPAPFFAGSAVFILDVQVDPAAAPGSTIGNTVTAISTNDPDGDDRVATATAAVVEPTGGPAPVVEVPALGPRGLAALVLLLAALALFKLRA
jgi:uncharacterized repeat protein (TIGR01451 family)